MRNLYIVYLHNKNDQLHVTAPLSKARYILVEASNFETTEEVQVGGMEGLSVEIQFWRQKTCQDKNFWANPTKRFKDLAKQWQVYFAVFTALSSGKNCSAIDVYELNLPWLLGQRVNK